MKKIITFLLIILLLTGCQNKDQVRWEKEIKNLQETAIQDSSKKIYQEDITEAITYLKQHILNPINNREVAKKIIYYSTYLTELGNKKEENKDHIITKVSSQIQDYITSLYKEKTTNKNALILSKGNVLVSELLQIKEEDISSFITENG